MKVRVLLFARYQAEAGTPAMTLDLPEGATLGSVWRAVVEQVPSLRNETGPLMALDRAYAAAAAIVPPGSEVAFFPPVSGG